MLLCWIVVRKTSFHSLARTFAQSIQTAHWMKVKTHIHIRLQCRTCYTLHPIRYFLFFHIAWNSILYLLALLAKSSGYVFFFSLTFSLTLLFSFGLLSLSHFYHNNFSFLWWRLMWTGRPFNNIQLLCGCTYFFAYYAHDFNGLIMTSESGVFPIKQFQFA